MQLIRQIWRHPMLWAFADQCVVSGSTIVVNILIVALIGLDAFGMYALYWLIVLLLASFHQSLMIMPFYTLFAKIEDLDAYISQLVKEQLRFSLLSIVLVLFIAIGMLLAGSEVDFLQFALVGILVGAYCFQDFFRRIFYVKKRAKHAFAIDVISEGILPLVLVMMAPWVAMDINLVLLATIALKLLSILVGWFLIRPKVKWFENTREVRLKHWQSGKFLLASNGLQWLSGNAFLLVCGMLLGPVSIGVLRIAQSILGCINVFLLFLENRIPVEAARVLHSGGEKHFTKYMMRESKRYFVLLLLSLTALAVFHEHISTLFFGNAMLDYPWLIPTFCLLYVFIYIGTMLRFTFRTLDKNAVLFYGYMVSAVVGLSCVYPMIQYWGVSGAVMGLFLSQITTITTYLYYLKRQL